MIKLKLEIDWYKAESIGSSEHFFGSGRTTIAVLLQRSGLRETSSGKMTHCKCEWWWWGPRRIASSLNQPGRRWICNSTPTVRTIKPKRLKLKSPNSAQGYSSSRQIANQLILGQKIKGQGHRVKKCKKSQRDSRAAPSRSSMTPLNETAPQGGRELCTLSSASLIVDTVLRSIASK